VKVFDYVLKQNKQSLFLLQ